MNKPNKSYSVEECKIQASLLLKMLRSDNVSHAEQAAKRFKRLPELKNFSSQEIIRTDIKRKQALAVIALENGFKSWTDLKCQLPFIHGGFLNHWFAHYEQAKSFLQSHGGFLLPFKNQFFVCDADYINNLGFDAQDPDWKLIGHDWTNQDNKVAWQRLYKKWMIIQKDNV